MKFMFINAILVILRLHSACSEFKELTKLWCYKLGLTFFKIVDLLKSIYWCNVCITLASLDVRFRGIQNAHVQRNWHCQSPYLRGCYRKHYIP